MKEKTRNSNYELLRIVSMFYIVLYHIIVHGKVIENSFGTVTMLALIIKCITLVHVNCFILITGYFQCKSKFRFSKVWQLVNISLFYKILILVVLIPLGLITLNYLDIIKQLSFLNFSQYWFVKIYIFLYCLTPFLNKLINSMSKSEFTKLLLVLFVIMSLIPYITGLEGFDNNGLNLYNMVFMYFIGAYLRIYPLKDSYLFKKCSKQLFQVILFSIYCMCIVFNITILSTSYLCKDLNLIFNDIYKHISLVYWMYSTPLVIIQSIAFFTLFGTFDIKNRFINKISSLTLGIYLIHDNNFMGGNLFRWIGVNRFPIYSCRFLFYIFVVAVTIFIVGSIVEFIRQCLFKFIYNRKISKKIRDKYNNWIHNLKFTSY